VTPVSCQPQACFHGTVARKSRPELNTSGSGSALLCNAAPTPNGEKFHSIDSFYEALKIPEGSAARSTCAMSALARSRAHGSPVSQSGIPISRRACRRRLSRTPGPFGYCDQCQDRAGFRGSNRAPRDGIVKTGVSADLLHETRPTRPRDGPDIDARAMWQRFHAHRLQPHR
jgi:hypothetical protein